MKLTVLQKSLEVFTFLGCLAGSVEGQAALDLGVVSLKPHVGCRN